MRLPALLIAISLLTPHLASARTLKPAERARFEASRMSRRTLRATVREERVMRSERPRAALVPLSGEFSDIQSGVSIRYPLQWERQNLWEQDGALTLAVLFLSPLDASGTTLIRQNINLVMEDIPKQMTLQEYTAAGIRNEELLLPEFQLISSQRSVIAGYPGQRVRFTARTDSGTMGFEQIWILRNGVAHIWTFADAAETFNANLVTFDAMLDTLIVR